MDSMIWFDDIPIIGKLPASQATCKLREVGETNSAEIIESTGNDNSQTYAWTHLCDKPWLHTAHTLGYLPPSLPNSHDLCICQASNIVPDQTLKNSRINVTLNGLRVASYPGSGTHQILFDFYAQNQLLDTTEDLHFNSTYQVREGERAAILNYPIFVGLRLGNNGLNFKCFTVNVKNDEDKSYIQFLESDAFRTGLQLATIVQPAIKPLSEMAIGLTKMVAKRHNNIPVQDIQIGLDFSNNPMGARLAEGIYIAVQIPETLTNVWDWRDWIYDTNKGQIVKTYDRKQLIPYNYIAFGIHRYDE
jgi:hypothetical protein